jgi:serine/threonine protein kinase
MSVEGYDLLSEIARDVGHVSYEARQRSTGRRVVLQIVPTRRDPPVWRDELLSRLRAVALLDHPHLVPVLAVGEAGSSCYLVRPCLSAVTLASYVRSHDDLPTPRRAAVWVEQLAGAVAHCHDHGVFGPFISGHDVLIESEEARLDVLQVAHVNFLSPPMPPAAQEPPISRPFAVCPEQVRGEGRSDDPRRDVWALGVLLYFLLTGHLPFGGPGSFASTLRAIIEEEPIAPRVRRPEVAADLDAVCLRCLRKDPAERYQEVRQLAEALRAHLEGRAPSGGEPVSLTERLRRWMGGWWSGG